MRPTGLCIRFVVRTCAVNRTDLMMLRQHYNGDGRITGK